MQEELDRLNSLVKKLDGYASEISSAVNTLREYVERLERAVERLADK